MIVGGRLTARPDIYARISSDLATIEALEPEVIGIPARPLFEPSNLTLRLDLQASDDVAHGNYHAWDCLNAWYGGSVELCARPQGDTFRYFYRDLHGVAWYFTSTPGSPPVLEGTRSGTGPYPDWYEDWASCEWH